MPFGAKSRVNAGAGVTAKMAHDITIPVTVNILNTSLFMLS